MAENEETPPLIVQQPTQNYPSNFPLPSPMTCRGDLTSNWEFFKQQFMDYEVAMGLNQRSEAVRLATFRSVMGRECLQIFLNLNLGQEAVTTSSAMEALQGYFLPKRNVVYESKPLVSYESSEQLGLLKLDLDMPHEVNKVDVSSLKVTKESILNEYKDVFEGLGHIGDSILL
ncbi:hypothetical protein QZH41_006917 [Actinostola sp. cb2023]|nr:hypothetical protein QZH41_006917 [Actinostola sp. cb2023]